MKKIIYFVAACLLILTQACYEDYKFDYAYSTTYFSKQYPLRSIIVEEGEDLTFKIGVVLAGKYSNETTETVSYEVDPSLLDLYTTDYPDLKLLPDNYYEIPNQGTFSIKKGEITGTETVKLNKELFLSDPLAVSSTYALPLRIVEATTDSVKFDKDYTIIVLRYYNQYHGSYWLKGADYTLNPDGTFADTALYTNKDLVLNRDLMLSTYSKNEILTSYIGSNSSSGTSNYSMKISVAEDGVVSSLDGVEMSELSELNGGARYDKKDRKFTLLYYFKDATGTMHQAFDTLYYRNTEMYIESWKQD